MSTSDDTLDLQALKEYISDSIGSAVLPEVLDDIIEKALELGVEKPSDFQYVDERDLQCLSLKKIQIRKLLKSYEKEKTSTPLPSLSPCSSVASLSDSSSNSNRDNWSIYYTIPWSKMPKGLQDSTKKMERPLPAMRREMIRILADDISKISNRPKRSHLAAIASKLVMEYPKSFQDNLEDAVVGTGYNSILTQLECRFQNINRRSHSTSGNSDTDQATKKRKRTSTSSYGTISQEYQPDLPDEENEATQELKREALKDIYSREVWSIEEVEQNMCDTYPTVRYIINESSLSIREMKNDWPFLFEKIGMLNHFERLVGIKLQDKLVTAFRSKVPRVMQFMNASQNTNKPLKKILCELEDAKREDDNKNPEILGFLLVLGTYFREEHSEFIHVAEETSLEADINREVLPITPCVIALGSSALKSNSFMLAIDKEVVNSCIGSHLEALCMLFAAFFIFNIEYPKTASATFEFVQRCLVSINPDTGSKSKNRWRGNASPKVLQIINSLKDFESDWC